MTRVDAQTNTTERWSSRRMQQRFAGRGGLAGADVLRPLSLTAMRILIGVLFVWFGALKVAGASPVAGLVAGTLPWADPQVAVIGLGTVELLLGAALVVGLAVRLVLPALAAHLGGTFLTFAMLPALMFRHHDPLLLTADGEFVAKNLVLISATVVLIAHSGRSATLSRGSHL